MDPLNLEWIDPTLTVQTTTLALSSIPLESPDAQPDHNPASSDHATTQDLATLLSSLPADPSFSAPIPNPTSPLHASPSETPAKPLKRADKRNNPLGKNQFPTKNYASDEVLTERLTTWEKEGRTVGVQMGLLEGEFGLVVGRTTFKKLRERLAIVTKSEVRKLPSETIKSAVLEVAARGLGVVAIHDVLMKSELPVSHGIIRTILKNADPSGLATAVAPAKRIAQRKKELRTASASASVSGAGEASTSASASGSVMGGAGPSRSGSRSPARKRRRRDAPHDVLDLREEGFNAGDDEGYGMESFTSTGLLNNTNGSPAGSAYENRTMHTSESHERTRTTEHEHDYGGQEDEHEQDHQQDHQSQPDLIDGAEAVRGTHDDGGQEQDHWTLAGVQLDQHVGVELGDTPEALETGQEEYAGHEAEGDDGVQER